MQFMLAYGDDLKSLPDMRNQMLVDRRLEFKDRLGWNLETDSSGRETDEYDALNPLYVIVTDQGGRHAGSTRLMPTTGRTMIAETFAHLTAGVAIASETTWEITRFFVPRRDDRRLAPALMWAGCEIALRSGVTAYVGVVAAHMVRVFALFGAKAEVIGHASSPEGEICACIWEITEELSAAFRKAARLEAEARLPQPLRPRGLAPARAKPEGIVFAPSPRLARFVRPTLGPAAISLGGAAG